MDKYYLFTDSTTDLPQSFFDDNDVEAVYLSYVLDGSEHRDDLDTESKLAFYAKMRAGAHPVTSQINVDQFTTRWTPIMEEGADIVYLAFSSGLSGTCNGAVFAKQILEERYPERHIYVVDSLAASVGEGLLAIEAAKKRASGLSAKELANYLEENKLKMHHWFTVDDLVYLRRGGRVSAAAAFVGSLLNIKPMLHVNVEGKLIPLERVKGRKKSVAYLFDRFMEFASNKKQLVGISHADCIDDAKALASMIKNAAPVEDVLISDIGAVIGSHAGPGTLALFFFGPSRKDS